MCVRVNDRGARMKRGLTTMSYFDAVKAGLLVGGLMLGGTSLAWGASPTTMSDEEARQAETLGVATDNNILEQIAEYLRRRPGTGRTNEIPELDLPELERNNPPGPDNFPRNYRELKALHDDPNADIVPVPDRWRLIEALGVNERWYDPYNQNTLKGDRPIKGTDDWFVIINAISDTVYEPRTFPVPVGIQTTQDSESNSLFGDYRSTVFNQNLIANVTLLKGDTAYKPPDLEFRITPVFNVNHVLVEEKGILRRQPERGTRRRDYSIGLQDFFVDYHIRNVSDRYDFDSLRFGIQPFNADFRGFLFQDQQFGFRVFGTRDNNFWQYNLAWFRRLEKDTNSGLNDITERLRDDDVFVANLYRQDWPVLGYQSQGTVVYNRNREDDRFFYNKNDILERPQSAGLERPRSYDVLYLGYNGDGHFGKLNLTTSFYYAYGSEETSIFSDGDQKVRAWFAAAEPSMDFDWYRVRGSLLFASGDDDPFDNRSEGFSAIFENPQFAGADTSYWIRQTVPLIGGGGLALSARNGLLNDLRTSKEHGQSNFVNPGMRLIGAGADFDVTPELRISANANKMYFFDTSSLEAYRNQGNIDSDIGWDISAAVTWRPFMTQNIVLRASYAELLPGDGFKDLYAIQNERLYSVLFNLVLAY